MSLKKLDTIVLIDDDEVANFIYGKIINNAGITNEIKTFQYPEKALEYLKSCAEGHDTPPELIFLDINMPVMSGWDFLEEYKKFASSLNGKTNVFLLSSSVYQEDLDKAGTFSEVKEYVTKPLTNDKLIEIRDKYFSNNSTHNDLIAGE